MSVLGMPFNAQLYVLMNAHFQNMLNSIPRKEKVKVEEEDNEEHVSAFDSSPNFSVACGSNCDSLKYM